MLAKGIIVQPFETVRKHKDGTRKYVWIVVSNLNNKQGETIGVSVIARDITERKQSEKERSELLAKLNILIEEAPVGVAFMDDKGRYLKLNSKLAVINDISPESHIGKTPHEVLPARLASKIVPLIDTVLQTRNPVTEEIKNKDYYLVHAYPIKLDQELLGIGFIMQNITEQKELHKRKDDFISMASHELKTPVTSIKAFTQLLKEQKISSRQADVCIEKIENQTNRLIKLIQDFLDVSKIKNGRLHLVKEWFNFNIVVGETIKNIESVYTTHTVEIEGRASEKIYADKDRIAQVLYHLLHNAIKYSPQRSRIKVMIVQESSHLRFSVEDKGIGISSVNQSQLFQPFFRVVGEHQQEFPGLGIGLYISSEIIKKHKGTIEVVSKKRKGSTFTVILPVQ